MHRSGSTSSASSTGSTSSAGSTSNTRSTRRLILLALVGLVLFIWLNWFPPSGSDSMQTDMSVMISKQEAQTFAEQFVRSRYSVREIESLVMYDAFEMASGYWLKEKQQDAYEREWQAVMPMDYYRVALVDKQAQKEYEVLLDTTNGRVIGWTTVHITDFGSDDPVYEMTGDATMAASLLPQLGYDPSRFRNTESRIDDKTKEQTFIYEFDTSVGEAALQIHVAMRGTIVGAVTPHIQLPDAYSSWKSRQDFIGALYGIVGLLCMLALAFGAIICLAIYRHSMNFKRGIWLTFAFAVPYLIHNVNMYPGLRLALGGEGGSTMILMLLFYQGLMLLMAIAVYLCLVAGEGMWRKMGFSLWPERREPGFARHVTSAVGKGYLICFFVLGIQTLMFYLAAEWFDVWSTSRPMESVHNLLIPGLYPLLAWSASISEEAIFRLFAIVILCWLFRPVGRMLYRLTRLNISRHPLVYVIPAVLISSMLWALGHMGYSIYPIYTRFVEVSVLGFIFAYALIRYGLLTAIFAHAAVDLIIMAFQIMYAGEQYVVTGLLYMLMPAAIALIARSLEALRLRRLSEQ